MQELMGSKICTSEYDVAFYIEFVGAFGIGITKELDRHPNTVWVYADKYEYPEWFQKLTLSPIQTCSHTGWADLICCGHRLAMSVMLREAIQSNIEFGVIITPRGKLYRPKLRLWRTIWLLGNFLSHDVRLPLILEVLVWLTPPAQAKNLHTSKIQFLARKHHQR